METKFAAPSKRIDNVEEKCKAFQARDADVASIKSTIRALESENVTLPSRANDLEARSRRNNLIIWYIPDAKETWEQTENKVTSALKTVLPSFSSDSIERAFRLGILSPGKCRPTIVKFGSFKFKDNVLLQRYRLKTDGIVLHEDYSPATRLARRNLIEFGKDQPGAPSLRHDKLIINKKCYVFDAVKKWVTEKQSQG